MSLRKSGPQPGDFVLYLRLHFRPPRRPRIRPRQTARVYLFDPAGRVLLIHFVVPRPQGDFRFWLTPGGEIEPGETPAAAARRELLEELGLDLIVHGPIYTEANRFEHQGEMRDNTDHFFTAQCASAAPILRGVTAAEIAIMREIRWWTALEIRSAAAAGDRFFPPDLAARIRQFAPANPSPE